MKLEIKKLKRAIKKIGFYDNKIKHYCYFYSIVIVTVEYRSGALGEIYNEDKIKHYIILYL